MQYRPWSYLAATCICLGVACQSPSAPDSSHVAKYGVGPTELDMVIDQTVTLTIVALSARGDTLPVGSAVIPHILGTAGFLISGCDRVGDYCLLTARTSGVGTLSLEIGNYGRCLDGPECMAQEWLQDTVIAVPARVR